MDPIPKNLSATIRARLAFGYSGLTRAILRHSTAIWTRLAFGYSSLTGAILLLKKNRSITIRTRLAFWYSGLTLAILLLLSGIYYAGYREMLQEQKDYLVRVVADILDSSIPRIEPGRADVQRAMARMVKDYPDIESKGLLIEVYDRSQKLLFSSSVTESERLPITKEIWAEARKRKPMLLTLSPRDDFPPIRILTKPVFHRNQLVYVIQVGSSMQDIETTQENLLFLNLFFIPVVALLVGVGGWFLTRKALSPLDSVIRTARRIRSGDLSQRIGLPPTGIEIEELSEALNQMIARLEASFLQIRDFTDNVSHELRIPLAILKGQTELSLRRPRSEEEYRLMLQSNLEEILRMEKIVERLLFLSRADRGEIRLNRTEVLLDRLLEEVHRQFQIPARLKGIALALDSKGPVSVLADELMLREVLLNLVQNAVRHTPAEGRVALFLEKENGRVGLGVADTGCGIPENEIPRIFNRFYRVDQSHSGQGNGLGLSICKWIVEAHQGEIAVESAVGKGSRFTVFLPGGS